jgi:hypothetical protein
MSVTGKSRLRWARPRATKYDPTQFNDLAAKIPDKLKQMQDLRGERCSPIRVS